MIAIAAAGGEDLYLEQTDAAVGRVPELSPVYSLHVGVSGRAFDTLSVHAECTQQTLSRLRAEPGFERRLRRRLALQLGLCTSLVWEDWETSLSFAHAHTHTGHATEGEGEGQIYDDTASYASEEDTVSLSAFRACMAAKAAEAMAFLDAPPAAAFFAPGTLPRNARTGKVPKIVDHRK
jgi:hypothetical protein